MSVSSGVLSFDLLVAEQAAVQANKERGRELWQYDRYLFQGSDYLPPKTSKTIELLGAISSGELSISGILEGLQQANPDEQIRWTDLGGGRAVALRQMAYQYPARYDLTNIDLCDHGLDSLPYTRRRELEEKFPGIADPAHQPRFVQDDIQATQLEQPAHLLTSVENVQYLDNPLGFLANTYNQLHEGDENTKNGGVMVVTAEHRWSDNFFYPDLSDKEYDQELHPMKDFCSTLSAAGIRYAVSKGSYNPKYPDKVGPREISTLAIQRKAHTALKTDIAPIAIEANEPYYGSYKFVSYPRPTRGQAVVSVTG